MYRECINKLHDWKNKKDRKPLLVTGVRQCGKTYLLRKFGEESFKNCAYFNFEKDSRISSVFEEDFDTDRIIFELSNLILGWNIEPETTVVIFDEIQTCPRAVTSLKYFCEDKRELHIIGAGSLLGVALNRQGTSFPVGKVERLKMYPMSFREFLMADGYEKVLMAAGKVPLYAELSEAYTKPLASAYKTYLTVGGMPEAVKVWCDSHDISKVEEIQDNILADYEGDFAKHAPKTDIPKLGWIWDSVPVQLAKENNKFVFSHVKKGKRSAELEDALQWLSEAGLVYKICLVNDPQVPLSAFCDTTYFKVYMADTGLLRRKSHIPASAVIGENELFQNYKGALTENYVLGELIQQGISPYFWRSGNQAEVDFVFDCEGRIFPVEVKAADHTRAKSYLQFCKKYGPTAGFKFSMKNIGENEVDNTRTISLPLYMIWKLEQYINS